MDISNFAYNTSAPIFTYLFSCSELHPDVDIGVLPPPHLRLHVYKLPQVTVLAPKDPQSTLHLHYDQARLEMRVIVLDLLDLREPATVFTT